MVLIPEFCWLTFCYYSFPDFVISGSSKASQLRPMVTRARTALVLLVLLALPRVPAQLLNATDDCAQFEDGACAFVSGGSDRALYVSVRIIMMAITFVCAAFVLCRILLTILAVRERKLISEARFQIQTILFVAVMCEGIQFVDIIAIEGMFTLAVPAVMAAVRNLALLFAVARALHVFITIHSRFHPPSRKLASGLLVFTLLYAVCNMGIICFQIASSAQWPVSFEVVANDLFALCLLVCSQFYIVSMLRLPKDAALLRTITPAEHDSRNTLLRLLKGVQILGFLIVCVAVAEIVITQLSVSLLIIWAVFGVLVDVGAIFLCMFVSGSRRERPVAPLPRSDVSCVLLLICLIDFVV